MALEGHRFTPQEGLEAGLVDKLVRGDTEAVLAEAMIVARTTAPFAREGVWGLIKVRATSVRLSVDHILISLHQENVYAEVLAASRDEHSPFTLQNLARARL